MLEKLSNISPCVTQRFWKHGLNKEPLRPTACSRLAQPCTSAIVQWPVGWTGQTKPAHRSRSMPCVWVGLDSKTTSATRCSPLEARGSGCHARYPRRRWRSTRRTPTTWWGRGSKPWRRQPVRHVMPGDTTNSRNAKPPEQSYTPGRSTYLNPSSNVPRTDVVACSPKCSCQPTREQGSRIIERYFARPVARRPRAAACLLRPPHAPAFV